MTDRLDLAAPAPQECSLTDGATVASGLDGVQQHVLRTLAERPDLAARLDPDLPMATFAAVLREKSEGNFLYVHHLLGGLETQQGRIDRPHLDELPLGLDGIYLEFLDRLAPNAHYGRFVHPERRSEQSVRWDPYSADG